MIRWLKFTAGLLGATVIMAMVAVVIVQRVSDGPMEFLQGGPFKTGELVEGPVTDCPETSSARRRSDSLLRSSPASRHPDRCRPQATSPPANGIA